ncbi:hypothetical protein FRB91_001624 [Serendipita sp. 411]|nr:hypothetical protein FRB91_001624 [Serendipita sp. 411]
MYNFFPLFRGALLGTVAAWTFIVLGIAIHFQMSFVDSAPQLTYVSLAVFVAAVTLALFLVVLVAPCNRKVSNILRTKWELAWLGVLAILWTALAGYTTSPAAKDNEVECWDEDEDGVVVEADVQGYSNDVYHARYRVLQGFAFFNCILLLFLFLFILALAFWHHKRGRYVIWTTPTTSVGWFDGPTGKGTGKHLPPPITHRKSNKDKEYEEWDNEKETGSGRKRGFKFDHSSISEKVRDTVKDKIGKRYKDTDDYDEILAKRDLIQKPPAVARANTAPLKPKHKSRPAVAKRDQSVPRTTEPRRQPSQTRGGGGAPDVVRSGSGAGNGGRAKASANANANLSSSQPQIHRNNSSRRNESGTDQRANKSSEEEGRYKSNNPYKTSGRRI